MHADYTDLGYFLKFLERLSEARHVENLGNLRITI